LDDSSAGSHTEAPLLLVRTFSRLLSAFSSSSPSPRALAAHRFSCLTSSKHRDPRLPLSLEQDHHRRHRDKARRAEQQTRDFSAMTAQVFFFFAEYKQIEAAAAAAAFFLLFNPLQKRIATVLQENITNVPFSFDRSL